MLSTPRLTNERYEVLSIPVGKLYEGYARSAPGVDGRVESRVPYH